jgi:hypothetical protein
MGFRYQDGKKVVLRGMSIGTPRTVSAKRMERIFRHGEVVLGTRVDPGFNAQECTNKALTIDLFGKNCEADEVSP